MSNIRLGVSATAGFNCFNTRLTCWRGLDAMQDPRSHPSYIAEYPLETEREYSPA